MIESTKRTVVPTQRKSPERSPVKIFGHRGCRGKEGIAENSLAAFEVALENADGIELDVFLTTNDQLVVFHDETLEKLTDGTGPITSHSLDQLKALRLREKPKSEIFTEDTIPTLDEVLKRVEEARAAHPDDQRLKDFKVCIEIKDPAITGKVRETINNHLGHGENDLSIDNFEVRSFNMPSLVEMKKKMPEMQLGVLFAGPKYPWDTSEALLKELLEANKGLFDESDKIDKSGKRKPPNNTVSVTLNTLTDDALKAINETIGLDPKDGPRITPWTAGEINPDTLDTNQQKALVATVEKAVGKGGAFITDFPEEMKKLMGKYRGTPEWGIRTGTGMAQGGGGIRA